MTIREDIIDKLKALKRRGLVAYHVDLNSINFDCINESNWCISIDPSAIDEWRSIIRDNYTKHMLKFFFRFLREQNAYNQFITNFHKQTAKGGWSRYQFTSFEDYGDEVPLPCLIQRAFPWDDIDGTHPDTKSFQYWSKLHELWRLYHGRIKFKFLNQELNPKTKKR